jgi:hypothetical protein
MHEYIKYLFVENLLVTVVVIFVILYIYFNMDLIRSGDYLNGYLSRPITYTCVVVLVGLLLAEYCKSCTDDKSSKTDGYVKTYKVVNQEPDNEIFISSRNKHMFGLNM